MKYLRIFFTFLGYVTFLCLIGAATFWYLGRRKAQERAQVIESTVTYQDNADPGATTAVPMTPARTLPDLEPISTSTAVPRMPAAERPRITTRTTVPKATRPNPKPAPVERKPVLEPITYAAPKKETLKPTPKARRSAPPPSGGGGRGWGRDRNEDDRTGLPAAPLTVSYRATDNTASLRTGGRRLDMGKMSALEQDCARRAKAWRELEGASDQIRNPKPTWESGVVKVLAGEN